jgi:hypothetical protein
MTMAQSLALENATEVRIQNGLLFAIVDGEPVSVRLRQCFPWSEPHRFLSLRDEDDEEVALIEEPAVLAPESRNAIEQGEVETKHGPRSFQTHLDDWPRALPNGGLLIRDVAGDLYLLAAPGQMDRKSKELLWAFVD